MTRHVLVMVAVAWFGAGVPAAAQDAQQAAPPSRGEPRLPEDKKVDAPVQFVLLLDDERRCTVLKYDGVASLKVHNHVRWDLKNECGGRRRIEFRNFRRLEDGAADCSGTGAPGQPGPGDLEDSFTFNGRIRLKLSEASSGRWCFDVHLDGGTNPIDPMIRIDR